MISKTLSSSVKKCERILAPLLITLLFALPVHAVGRTSISMWVYPIGDFSDPDTVNGFIQAFERTRRFL